MKPLVVVSGLLIMLTATLSESASGQARLFQQRRGSQSQPNADHERAKTEADQAYRRGDYRRTEALTSNVLDENPRDDVALYLRASARVEIGLRRRDNKLIRSGIADAREAIRLDRNEAMYYLPYLYGMTNLANVEDRDEHAGVAVTVADQALDLRGLESGDRANLLYQRGNAHKRLKDYDAATDDFQQAIVLNRGHLGAHVGLAETKEIAGKTEEALDAYSSAVEAFPSNPLVYNNRGMFQQKQQRFAAAIADFTRAIEIDANSYYAYTNRGAALLEMGETEAAIADFSASLRLNSRQPSVYNFRSIARLAQGDVEGAVTDQLQVVQLIPQFAPAHADLGYVRFFAEDYRNALNAFNRALELDPKLRHLHVWQYWTLKLSQQDDDATALLESLTGDEQTDWVDHVLGYLAGKLTETELAESASQSDKDARNKQLCEAHFFMGLQKQHSGEPKEAQDHFQQAVATNASELSAYRGAQFALKRLAAESKTSGL